MRNYFSVILNILVLAGAGLGTFFWSQAWYESLVDYRSPLADSRVTAQPVTLSEPVGVVVVLVSGLGETTPEQFSLPNFTQISQTGASTVVQGVPPTYAQTARMGVVTGAPPETNGAPPLDVPSLSVVKSDTIFSRAHAAGLKTALLGPGDWRHLVPRSELDETFFVDVAGPEADQLIFENAQSLLQTANVDLLFVNFTQLAFAARHAGGTDSNAYQQAAFQIDDYLGQLYQSIDFGRQVLVILGDHGFTPAGGLGGAEPDVTRRPLLMSGDAVAPGNYSDISQNDVAPTVTTLLGVAPPAWAQGRILFEMLRLDEQEQAVAQLALAHQRVDLIQAYAAAVAGQAVKTTLGDEVQQAELVYTQKNSSGAFELARLAQQTADTQMASIRHQHIRSEQYPRLFVAVVILFVWAVVMWRRRGRYVSVILMAAVLTIGLYHLLYQLQGFEYSLSTITDFSDWPFSIGRRITVSLLAGGGFILILLMLTSEDNWAVLLGTSYGFGVLVTFIFALPLFWAFWKHGFTVTWYLPNVNVAFWQTNALYETMITAILGLLLPWPITLLIAFVNLIRRSLDRTRSQPKQDALPGLHL